MSSAAVIRKRCSHTTLVEPPAANAPKRTNLLRAMAGSRRAAVSQQRPAARGCLRASPLHGFTLVELLVVIGIVALLVAILLPALNRARKHATQIQCASNMRTIGQAITQYSNNNRGCVMPCAVTKSGTGTDYWATMLIGNDYLPDPDIPDSAWGSPTASTGSVTVCPAARDSFLWQNGALAPGATATSVALSDGFERDGSAIIQPPTASRIHGLIVEVGYGINGLINTSGIGAADPWYDVVSNTVVFDNVTHPTQPYRLKKMVQFKDASITVMLYDGVLYNQMNGGSSPSGLLRISGGRHGKFDVNRPYDTGICNVLFLDGHVESVDRARLPTQNPPYPGGAAVSDFQFVGTPSKMRDPTIVWSIDQQQ